MVGRPGFAVAITKVLEPKRLLPCDTAGMTDKDNKTIARSDTVAMSGDATAVQGNAILKQLGPALAKRGVPETSYVMVNLANSEFVTGKTKAETQARFAAMHPGAEGWMQLVGDVIGVSLADRARAQARDGEAAGFDASEDADAVDGPAPRNPSSPRWNGRRGPSR